MAPLDYRSLGLKVGIEIHQQLSGKKLFCNCPAELSETVVGKFERTLRPSASEMGEVDRAAIEEAQKSLRFIYESTPCDCLVEADEEPPHRASQEAIECALLFARMVDARPVDEIEFMRKIVIDGSNTAGFQRTALIAMDGMLRMENGTIGIETICLEEDAARRISEEQNKVVFRLDRLGIPLIEIATSPEIDSPERARTVAERIGVLLRATKRVRRGIGTIREDLNISITGGARVEIKGVQELDLIPKYVENEVRRQLALIAVRDELARRGVKEIPSIKVDVTPVFKGTKCKVLAKGIARGERVLAVRLPGFDDLMAADEEGTKRLGREFAMHARVAGAGGIFHSDELPGYGIEEEEVLKVRAAVHADKQDGIALIVANEEIANNAMDRVIMRARQALKGVPEETRDPLPDGTSEYSRPLPGRARMYPETDVPPIRVDRKLLDLIEAEIPELPEQIAHRLQKLYSLNEEQASALVRNGCDEDFEELVDKGIPAKLVARTLINTLPELRSEGLDSSALTTDVLSRVLQGVGKGEYAKEAVPEILRRVLRNGEPVDMAIERLGFAGASTAEVDRIIDEILAEKIDLIKEKGERSIAPLMGLAMEKLRGKADGKTINERLTTKVKELLASERRP
ncbi:MAG: Glu-tRNA(Gln) amidotransferase subunit GatE [Thermoplasmata archaeon]